MDKLMGKLSISESTNRRQRPSDIEDQVTATSKQLGLLSVNRKQAPPPAQETPGNRGEGPAEVEDDSTSLLVNRMCLLSVEVNSVVPPPVHANGDASNVILYSPNIQDSRYYDQNRVLFYSYVERMLRHGRTLHPSCYKQ